MQLANKVITLAAFEHAMSNQAVPLSAEHSAFLVQFGDACEQGVTACSDCARHRELTTERDPC